VTRFGQPVKTPEQWRARRAEIVELFCQHVFGRVPETAYTTTWKVESTDTAAMGGAATLKLVRISVATQQGSLAFRLILFVPNKRSAPAPSFLLICNRGTENIDPTRRQRSEFWPAELLIEGGFAAAAFHNAEIDPDQDDGFHDGIHPLLDGHKPRTDDSWATIAAWAWGASRAMDYLVRDADLDQRQVAVIGHSRGGKTALWAGAQDERFALVVSNDSGCTGAALSRGKAGETVKMINASFPHWFCANYKRFNDREDQLPLDQHLLVAAIAPRAVYVASASEDRHADPQAEYRSWRLASAAWQLLGDTGAVPAEPPAVGSPLHLGRMGYHLREGGHDLKAYDWREFMAFAKRLYRIPALP
jgi:pimeloyl-ACP methyl ester carboxylesterase